MEDMMDGNAEPTSEADALILGLFIQACTRADGKFSHDCISAYEYAQDYLIAKGLIADEDCVYD